MRELNDYAGDFTGTAWQDDEDNAPKEKGTMTTAEQRQQYGMTEEERDVILEHAKLMKDGERNSILLHNSAQYLEKLLARVATLTAERDALAAELAISEEGRTAMLAMYQAMKATADEVIRQRDAAVLELAQVRDELEVANAHAYHPSPTR